MGKEKELPRRGVRRVLATRVCGIGALGTLGIGALTTVVVIGAGSLASELPAGAATLSSSGSLGEINSADVTFNVTLDVPNHYGEALKGNGQLDFAHHAANISVQLPAAGLQPHDRTASASKTTNTPATGAPITIRGEWVHDAAYLFLPQSLANLAGGGTTVSYPLPSAQVGDVDTSLSQSAAAISYAHLLVDTIMGAHTRRVGTRTIGGVKVTGTAVQLSLDELLKIVPALGPLMGSSLSPMEHADFPVTLWTDHSGRLIEASFSEPKSASAGLSGTVRFSNFNTALTISAPPADTVRPISRGELSFLQAENPLAVGG